MMAMLYNLTEVRHFFDSGAVKRGIDYYMKDKVVSTRQSANGTHVYGSVKGSKGESYSVVVAINNEANKTFFEATCSCYVRRNCKHAVALLFRHWFLQMDNRSQHASEGITGESSQIERWLREAEAQLRTEPKKTPAKAEKHLLYILKLQPQTYGDQLLVDYLSARKLKAGGYGASTKYDPYGIANYGRTSFMDDEDESIIKEVYVRKMMDHIEYANLSDAGGGDILLKMLATGRCFWQDKKSAPLIAGPSKKAEMHWRIFDDATQQLHFSVKDGGIIILPTTPPLYLDESTRECGALDVNVSKDVINIIQKSPRIAPDKLPLVTERLSKMIANLPKPAAIEVKNKKNINPVACMYLTVYEGGVDDEAYYYQDPVPVMKITMDYDGKETSLFEAGIEIRFMEGDQLISLKRNLEEEKKHLDLMESVPLLQLRQTHYNESAPKDLFVIPDNGYTNEQNLWVSFMLEVLPQFRDAGWNIFYDDDFPYRIAEIDEWHMDVEESETNAWFELDLGIIVDDKEYNLIHLISILINQNPRLFKKMQAGDASPPKNILMRVSENEILAIPYQRISQIVNVLVELFDKKGKTENHIKIPKWRAAELNELQSQGLTWQGGDALKKSADKISNFKGIKPKVPPNKFKANLRDYQKDGLAWLQFLREYDFHGVLADDMGLGKTIQALAHICAEKASKRLKQPVLVIAPTSLMYNWRHEAGQFAPHLTILTLHGPNRKDYFDSIGEHDIVLTTYPLLGRDDKVLLTQQWHMVILDEAQNIKNPKAKATKVACQLKANHRLCLTGTPMENHLGELWSMFHFLMPGLLGNEKQFKQLFRTPIEKHGDAERAKRLAKRLSPFMLRRKKDEVVKELPAKTEIVRSVALEGVQRDLYETVRISMQKKVRDSISKLGMGKSHIVVLDALLKLRQICCDPRLLKSNAKAKKANSAKFDLLMELLPELLEEGRKILLFSQFTSMLALIENELKAKKIKYVKLTGSTRNREKPIDAFQKGEVSLFLISLKAGGTGLNLTAADTVIHYDPWWNPAVEAQATDRAHRIGQKNPVFVYKLLTEGTVEARIQVMQETKQKLAEGLFNEAGKGKLPDAKSLEALFEPL